MGLVALPLAAATAPDFASCVRVYHSGGAIALVAVLMIVCSIAPFLLMNRWQRVVTATEAGLVYCGEPVFVSLLALFLPGWLSRWTGLVTAANVLLQSPWLEAKPERRSPDPAR
jgi:drug/metabolite transporter (DMT)-like permease